MLDLNTLYACIVSSFAEENECINCQLKANIIVKSRHLRRKYL
jgi:hypothetical protein